MYRLLSREPGVRRFPLLGLLDGLVGRLIWLLQGLYPRLDEGPDR